MRLIDADALIEVLGLDKFNNAEGMTQTEEWIAEAITTAPTMSIDIVRCKECKHRPVKENINGEDYGFNLIAPNDRDERCPCLVDDGWYSWMPEDDFYCGYGERGGAKMEEQE